MVPLILVSLLVTLVGFVMYHDFQILRMKKLLNEKDKTIKNQQAFIEQLKEHVIATARLSVHVLTTQQQEFNEQIQHYQSRIEEQRNEIAALTTLCTTMPRMDRRDERPYLGGWYTVPDLLAMQDLIAQQRNEIANLRLMLVTPRDSEPMPQTETESWF